jgi:cytochrome c oxidase subunit 4
MSTKHAAHSESHEHDAHSEHHGDFHLVPVKYLVATGCVLLVLTGVTVAASVIDFNAIDLPELNIIVAMAIAVVKASLVCLFFMHLRWDRPFNSFVLVMSIGLVGLFIAFAMTDRAEYGPDVREYHLVDLKSKEPTAIQSRIDEAQALQSARPAAPPQPETHAQPADPPHVP